MTTRSKSSSASAPLLSYASQSQFRTPAPQISPDTGRVVYLPTHDAALLRIMECLPNATAAEKRAALGWTIIPIDKFRYKMQNLVQKMKKNGVRQNGMYDDSVLDVPQHILTSINFSIQEFRTNYPTICFQG